MSFRPVSLLIEDVDLFRDREELVPVLIMCPVDCSRKFGRLRPEDGQAASPLLVHLFCLGFSF